MQMIRCMKCMEKISEGVEKCPHCGYTQDKNNQPTNALKKETILHGRYLIGNVIGQGGFGITYVGYDLTLEMKVAVKEYFPSGNAMRTGTYSSMIQWSFVDNDEKQWSDGINRFLSEARRMAKLDAVPSIVRVRDAFRENQTAYIVMDFVEGVTLKSYLLSHGVMNYEQCMNLLSPVLDSLAVIHDNGFIHRDISPDNIMIQPDGSARLLDMGAAVDVVANDGHASMAVVKRNFSAPEQYMDAALGSWTDVYAMGATIYYCLTGKVVPEAMEREFKQTPILIPAECGISSCTAEALVSSLELKAENRIQNMRELKRRLIQPVSAVSSSEESTAVNGTVLGSSQDGSGTELSKDGKKSNIRKWMPYIATVVAMAISVLTFGLVNTTLLIFFLLPIIICILLVKCILLKRAGKKILSKLKIGLAACVGSILMFLLMVIIGLRADDDDQTLSENISTADDEIFTEAETTAEAEGNGIYDGSGFYSLNEDGSYTLDQWTDDILYITVPEEFRGEPVTAIGDGAFADLSAEQIRLPDTVTILGRGIFDGCDSLRAVYLPSSVKDVQYPLVERMEEQRDYRLVYFTGLSSDEIEAWDWCDNWYGDVSAISCTGFSCADDPQYNGWHQDYEDEWMFFREGFAQFGVQVINGQTYYFQDDASAYIGWMSFNDGNEFYFDETDCHLVKGWYEIDGNWYYFDEKGIMLKNTMTPDGYEVDEEGIYVDR